MGENWLHLIFLSEYWSILLLFLIYGELKSSQSYVYLVYFNLNARNFECYSVLFLCKDLSRVVWIVLSCFFLAYNLRYEMSLGKLS